VDSSKILYNYYKKTTSGISSYFPSHEEELSSTTPAPVT